VKIIRLTIFDGTAHSNTLEQPIKMSLISPLSAPELQEKATILLYPNPAAEVATLTFSAPLSKNLKMEIFSLKGEIIRTDWLQKDEQEFKISVSSLQRGQYFIRFSVSDEKWSILKLQVK
jgi:hypothetical protein